MVDQDHVSDVTDNHKDSIAHVWSESWEKCPHELTTLLQNGSEYIALAISGLVSQSCRQYTNPKYV